MPPAARITDLHACPIIPSGAPISGPCVPNVLIGKLPAAVMGDLCACVLPINPIVKGSTTVLIGGRPAARMFDPCTCGGQIVIGCPTVIVGG